MNAKTSLSSSTFSANSAASAGNNQDDQTREASSSPVIPPAASNSEWPVLAVGTKVILGGGSRYQIITILVRVPDAVASEAGSRVQVRVLPLKQLLHSPFSTQASANFYSHRSPTSKLDPVEGPTEVVDGLAWLTFSWPAGFDIGELQVPDGAIVAFCRPSPTAPHISSQLSQGDSQSQARVLF
jgi:hypothetical protein